MSEITRFKLVEEQIILAVLESLTQEQIEAILSQKLGSKSKKSTNIFLRNYRLMKAYKATIAKLKLRLDRQRIRQENLSTKLGGYRPWLLHIPVDDKYDLEKILLDERAPAWVHLIIHRCNLDTTYKAIQCWINLAKRRYPKAKYARTNDINKAFLPEETPLGVYFWKHVIQAINQTS